MGSSPVSLPGSAKASSKANALMTSATAVVGELFVVAIRC